LGNCDELDDALHNALTKEKALESADNGDYILKHTSPTPDNVQRMREILRNRIAAQEASRDAIKEYLANNCVPTERVATIQAKLEVWERAIKDNEDSLAVLP